MNWSQFEDLVSHVGLAGTVVAPWSEMVVLSPFTVMINFSDTEFPDLSENI